jgi:predicted Fe-Mo cluster-binding NifX family protein
MVRVGVVLGEDRGVHGDVCQHFGQCKFFFLADIDEKKKVMIGTRTVPNTVSHGGGGCVAVDEILRYKVTHVISGGMGGGAQQKFANAGVKVFGYSGNVQKALDDFMNNALGGLSECKDHQEHGGSCH